MESGTKVWIPLQDLLSNLNAVISTNESTGHVIYNPTYTYKFQLKTIKEVIQTHLGPIWFGCIAIQNHLSFSEA